MEAIELGLRDIIRQKLSQSGIQIPDHILTKVRERMEKDRRKGLVPESADAQPLGHQLQYLDLRELEAVILAKAAWPLFEEDFLTKEQLSSRFTQLAELRNAIRHSRSVSQIAQKDGEAALMWFRARMPSSNS